MIKLVIFVLIVILLYYNCLYQWCISSNDNKCPICLTPIKKIVDIIDTTNNNDVIRMNKIK